MVEITQADCNVAEYIVGDRARDLDYQVVAYHREWSVLEERAAVVAYVRSKDSYDFDDLANDFEAGEHLK